MTRYLLTSIFAVALLSPGGSSLAQTVSPTAVEIHGPDKVYESRSAIFAAIIVWSDGTKSEASPSTLLWGTSSPAVATIAPNGTLTALSVTTATSVTVQVQYLPASLSASKSVLVLDSGSLSTVSYTVSPGWNLLGNTIASPISVSEYFGNALQPQPGISNRVFSVWKWIAGNPGKWAYFSPLLTPAQLEVTAKNKGYAVLRVIFPGEGFWVNLLPGSNVTLPAREPAAPVFVPPAGLVKNWNLIATAHQISPSSFNWLVSGLLGAPPQPTDPVYGMSEVTAPNNFVSLWVWASPPGLTQKKWYFYSPPFEIVGGLSRVTTEALSKGYGDFTTDNRALGHGVGFWVNVLPTNTNPSSPLTPLGQAKAMFSELRTTVRAYTNDLKSGFLDAQSTRMRDDLQNKVTPDLQRVTEAVQARSRAMALFEDIWKGNASSYSTGAGSVADTVRATRTTLDGSERRFCFSNDMTGTVVTASLLTDVTCYRRDTNSSAYTYTSATTRTQVIPFVKVFPDPAQGATPSSQATPPDTYNYKWETWKSRRLEVWNITTSTWVRDSDTQIAPPPGTFLLGTFGRTYLAGTTNLASFLLSGDINAHSADYDRNTLNLTGTRAVLDAGASTYRNSIEGSVVSKDSLGTEMVTLSIASGSNFDTKEDASGNPLLNSGWLRAVHFVGKAETTASRFTGTIDLNDFGYDADNIDYVPASIRFDGSVEDLSTGGAGVFLTGVFTLTANNLALYHKGQPESATNFLDFDTSFVGTIRAAGRPELKLTVGTSREGLDTHSISATYSYETVQTAGDPIIGVSIEGTGTLDTSNSANSTLTLKNQDNIVVTFQPFADAIIFKEGAESTILGVIPYGSSIVYFRDGYFESL